MRVRNAGAIFVGPVVAGLAGRLLRRVQPRPAHRRLRPASPAACRCSRSCAASTSSSTTSARSPRSPGTSTRSPAPRTSPRTPRRCGSGSRPAAADGSLDELPLRPELRGRTPYGAPQLPADPPAQHQREPAPAARRAAGRPRARRWGTPPWSSTATPTGTPSRCAPTWPRYLPRAAGAPIEPAQVWAANGSNEVLQQILQAFGGAGRTALGFTPSYSMHPIIAAGTGTAWVDGHRRADFTIDAAAAAAQVREVRPDVVFVTSPNNPTGTAVALETIEAIYDAHRGHGRRRRGLRGVRAGRHAVGADPAARPPAADRQPDDEQGVRHGGAPAGLPGRRPRRRRRAAAGAAALPPELAHPGRGADGAGAHRRAAGDGRRGQGPARPHRRRAAGAWG